MNSAPPSKVLLRPVLCEATVVSPPEVLADRSKNPKWPNSFLIMHLMCPWLSRVGSRIFCLGSRSSDHSPRTHLGFQATVPQDGARLRRMGWGKQLPTTLSTSAVPAGVCTDPEGLYGLSYTRNCKDILQFAYPPTLGSLGFFLDSF